MPRRRAGLVLAMALGVACGRGAVPEPRAAAAAAGPPAITAVVPDSGPAGVATPLDATIHGSNFAAEGNTVRFGPVTLADLSSSDGGTRIRFAVPKELPAAGEVPPMVLPPGEYDVSVTTARGTSNVVRFRLTDR